MYSNKVKKQVAELIQESTAYGLPNVYRSKRLFNKLFWMFFLVASFAGAFYYIVNDLVDYFNYEVVTTVKTEYDQPTEFPTISFCSLGSKSIHINNESIFDSDRTVSENPNNHFESFHSLKYGRCLRFNSGINMTNDSIPIKYSNSGGLYDAFTLTLFDPDGLAVWIHNKSASPSIERSIIEVRSNSSYYIEVERTFESKLEEPYNNCLKDVSTFKKNKTLVEIFLKKKETYSQEKCLDLCFDLFYINENQCKCIEAELGNVLTQCWSIEENSSYSGCTWLYRTKFQSRSLVEKCSEYCPLECDHMSFFLSIKNGILLTKSQVVIIVFYKTLKYTSITQLPKTKPEQLISNLGGYLGLFVGLSFASIFELTEIIFEIVFILKGKKNVIKPEMRQDIDETAISDLELLKTENENKLELFKMEYEEKFKLFKMEVNNLIDDIRNKFLVNLINSMIFSFYLRFD